MNARNLFAFALGLDNQWEIADFEISDDPSCLDIQLDFTPGEKFSALIVPRAVEFTTQ